MSKRRVLLAVTVAFIAALAVLTGIDLARNGVSALDLISILILVFFAIAIVGALRAPRDGE